MAVLLYKGFIASITNDTEELKEATYNSHLNSEGIVVTANDLNTLHLRFIIAIDNWMSEVRKWPIEEVLEFTCDKAKQAASLGKVVFKYYKILSDKYEMEAENLEFFLVAEENLSLAFPYLSDSEVLALEQTYPLMSKTNKFLDLDHFHPANRHLLFEAEVYKSYRMIPWDSIVLLLKHEQSI